MPSIIVILDLAAVEVVVAGTAILIKIVILVEAVILKVVEKVVVHEPYRTIRHLRY